MLRYFFQQEFTKLAFDNRQASRWFLIQRLLRPLPSLAPATVAVDATDQTPGERLFIYYAGQTVGIIDASAEEIRES